jgi:hypothetical protein
LILTVRVAAVGADEFLDAPAGLDLDVVAHGQCDDDAEVRLNGFAQVVVDRAGSQVVLGHSEGLLDVPQLVTRIDHELWGGCDEVGGLSLPSGQGTGRGLQLPIHALRRTRELDVAVPFDRGMPVDSAFGFGDLFVDAAQRAPGQNREVRRQNKRRKWHDHPSLHA